MTPNFLSETELICGARATTWCDPPPWIYLLCISASLTPLQVCWPLCSTSSTEAACLRAFAHAVPAAISSKVLPPAGLLRETAPDSPTCKTPPCSWFALLPLSPWECLSMALETIQYTIQLVLYCCFVPLSGRPAPWAQGFWFTFCCTLLA